MAARGSPFAQFTAFSRAGAIGVAVMGVAVCIGWFADITALKQVLPSLVSMKPNTAASFVAAGLSLLALQGAPSPGRRRTARVLAVLVLLTGLATITEYATGMDLGIDQLLAHDDPQAVSTSHPGRMAPAAAVAFISVGIALLLSRLGGRSSRMARWFAVPAVALASLAIVGYVYGVSSLYAIGAYASMAVHTAIGFFVLSLAVIALDPSDGFMAVVVGDTAGSLSARRLMPATAVILLSLGWLELAGLKAGLYDAAFGLALLVSTSMTLTLVVVAWHAFQLHNADLVRRASVAEIVALNASLEQKVEERTRTLTDALAEVHQLGALLPICAWCKRIRDDEDYWHSVDGYLLAHTDTRVTHGMCPDCQHKMLTEDTATG